jgi:NAD(P)H-hydrate epimerase
VLVVGGSRGMIGAPALAANAALRGGAGLVTVAAPESVQLAVATLCPCATSIPLSCNEAGDPAAESVRQVIAAAGRSDVLAVGPGMGVGGVQKDIVRAVLEQDKPVVLDADGLNNLAGIEGWAAVRRCPLVLTPHPGEFARLTGLSIGDIQPDREHVTVEAVLRWVGSGAFPGGRGQAAGGKQTQGSPLVCVLKGAGTVVTDGRRVYVNRTGNPGMATGGSGDVLTGLTAALIGQGLGPFDAARLAVYCHGRAGDRAAAKLGQASLIASDLLDYLPAAMRGVVRRS